MRMRLRHQSMLFVLCFFMLFVIRCSKLPQFGFYECGEEYEYTVEFGCIKSKTLCDPQCTKDERCEEGRCVERVPLKDSFQKECSILCRTGEYCQAGRCISIPCRPACSDGFVCSQGTCVFKEECIPPCSASGYACIQGRCEKMCIPSCEQGTLCIQGVCEKDCQANCPKGSFCRDGNCDKVMDKDEDGYPEDRDCDDFEKDIRPGAPEICNGKDDNCDGIIDNIVSKDCYSGPSESLGDGPCRVGKTTCESDQIICLGDISPKEEGCDRNLIDDDCNGVIDDGFVCPAGTICAQGECVKN